MIRFLNLKDQITEGSTEFAFYDTISDIILDFGERQDQVFSSIEGFTYAYMESFPNGSKTRPIDRFINKIPKDYFYDN